jgi:hypothetical protein
MVYIWMRSRVSVRSVTEAITDLCLLRCRERDWKDFLGVARGCEQRSVRIAMRACEGSAAQRQTRHERGKEA